MAGTTRSTIAFVVFTMAAATLVAQGPTVGQLIKQLRERSSGRRVAAAIALAEMGPAAKNAARQLARALSDETDEVAAAAAVALGRIGPAAKKTIKKALGDRKVQLRALPAVVALGADAADLLPEVTKMWRREELEIDAAVNECLKQLGIHAVPHLRDCLSDRNDSYAAARALGGLGPVARDAVPALIELTQEVQYGSAGAVTALGSIGDPRAVPRLIELLADITSRDTTVSLKASYAVRALGRIGPPAAEAVPKLFEMFELEEAPQYLPVYLGAALGGIGDDSPAIVRRLQQLRSRGGKFETAANEALGTLRPGSGTPEAQLLRNSKGHKRPTLRVAALQELGRRSAEAKVVEAVAELVTGSDKSVVLAAIAALSGWGSAAKGGCEALAKAAASDDPTIAKAAAAAISVIRGG